MKECHTSQLAHLER